MDIEQVCTAIADWASKEPLVTKAYVFGSRLKGTASEGSDLDVAIELQKEPGDDNVLATWIFEASRLRESIKPVVPYVVDLQHYDGMKTPHVHAYLNEASRVVYEAAA